MAFKTFSPGVLTSSDVNTFLMRQSVIVCTAATRPASPNEGMTIYETDTDLFLVWSGSAWINVLRSGAWQTFTPTLQVLVGSGTDWVIGNGTINGRYLQVGNLVQVFIEVVFGSTSTYGTGSLALGNLPINIAAPVSTDPAIGTSQLRDASLTTLYPGTVYRRGNNGATLWTYLTNATYATSTNISNTVPFTWANGDSISATFVYERA